MAEAVGTLDPCSSDTVCWGSAVYVASMWERFRFAPQKRTKPNAGNLSTLGESGNVTFGTYTYLIRS